MTRSIEEKNLAAAHQRMAMLARKRAASRKRKYIILLTVAATLIIGFFSFLHFYKNRANQAACIVNQTSITKAAHSHYGVHQTKISSMKELTSPHGPLHHHPPVCPSGGTYTLEWSSHPTTRSPYCQTFCTCEGHTEPK